MKAKQNSWLLSASPLIFKISHSSQKFPLSPTEATHEEMQSPASAHICTKNTEERAGTGMCGGSSRCAHLCTNRNKSPERQTNCF